MQVSKLIATLTIAAGLASTAFAQGNNVPAAPAAPAAKVSAPVQAAVEKKVEAPKGAEAAKAEANKGEAAKAKVSDKKVEIKTEVKAAPPAAVVAK